jgi:hypothetical protein
MNMIQKNNFEEDNMETKKEFELKEGKPILIRGGNGNLEIIGEELASPFIDYTGDPWASDTGKDFVDITGDDTITILINPAFEFSARRTVRLHLPKDPEHNLSAETSNGAIHLLDLKGRFKATTRNGRIELVNVTGEAQATCANGSISGKNIDGSIDLSSANGKIIIRESCLSGGSLKSGNGRIHIQMNPSPSGSFSIFSGNGRVKLALPEEGNFRICVNTRGRLYNNLESYSVQTEEGATIITKGEGGFSILIQNYRGGVVLMKYQDFDKTWNEAKSASDFENEFQNIGDFFTNLFGKFDFRRPHSKDWEEEDFSEAMKHFAKCMGRFGSKFGKMGEEISRQFSETGKKQGDDEVRVILEMLKEGRITAEEAEKLINALRGKHRS